MFPLQAAILIYTGILIESPEKRKSLMTFLNGAGAEVNKAIDGLSKKAGDKPNDTPELPEPTEFR